MRRSWRQPPPTLLRRSAPSRIGLLGLRRFCALLRPRLVELHAPFALLGLAHRQVRAEGAAAAAFEARYRAGGVAGLDQFARDRDRQRLARFALPDHEPAARIVARPARVALAVLDDLVPADRARPELRAGDFHVFQRLVELGDRLFRKARDIAHEGLARVLAALDLAQPVLPVARQFRRGQRVRVQQPDHVQSLLARHQRACVALDVATWISRSMIAARVAGVPIPESFIASRSSSSSTSLPAVSIAPSSEASL